MTLSEALEVGEYNTKPTRLRQGCLCLWWDPPATEEEYEKVWALIDTYGSPGEIPAEEWQRVRPG